MSENRRRKREEVELFEVDGSQMLDPEDDGKDRKPGRVLSAIGKVFLTIIVTLVILCGCIWSVQDCAGTVCYVTQRDKCHWIHCQLVLLRG